MQKLLTLLLIVFLSFPVIAKDDKGKKGHGAGGVRDDHASEMGMEKGKAWAGSKEKKVKEKDKGNEEGDSSEIEGDKKGKKEKKEEKEKKTKKAKKAK